MDDSIGPECVDGGGEGGLVRDVGLAVGAECDVAGGREAGSRRRPTKPDAPVTMTRMRRG